MAPLHKLVSICGMLLFGIPLLAQLSAPSIFSSNMILQRGKIVPVWGTASPKERITLRFGDLHLKTVTDAAGNWRANMLAIRFLVN